MKRSYFFAFLLVFCITIMHSCKKASDTGPADNTLHLGACTPVATGAFPVICFDSLISESRCPEGAVCVWQGYAAVRLSMKDEAGITQSFTLSTLDDKRLHLPATDTTISGYHITLLDVLPYPSLVKPMDGPYRIALKITK